MEFFSEIQDMTCFGVFGGPLKHGLGQGFQGGLAKMN